MFDDQNVLIRALMGQKTICSEPEAELIARNGTVSSFKNGDIIAKQGTLGLEAYFVLSGSVEVRISGHPYKQRGKNELIGEMSILQPGGLRSADLISTSDDTNLFVISVSKFHEVAKQCGDLWRCIAIEISERLKQRDSMFIPPNDRPNIFIASSSEGAARHLVPLCDELESTDRVVKPWNSDGIFTPSRSTLDALENQANASDFAVVLVTADDLVNKRSAVSLSPRDNVVFEAGLFMGALEPERVYLLVEKSANLSLPSDLNGITVMQFSDENELRKKTREIATLISSKGLMFRYCRPVI
jgi:CRP/FNR family cyclic AMP-dependent transcriptional regulator